MAMKTKLVCSLYSITILYCSVFRQENKRCSYSQVDTLEISGRETDFLINKNRQKLAKALINHDTPSLDLPSNS